MKLKQYLNESRLKTIYHGDNYKTTKLNKSLMNNGNNEVGIGIYFGTLDTAKSYGKNIISIDINPKDFKDGYGYANDILDKRTAINLLSTIGKLNKNFENILLDYGVETYQELWEMMGDNELRNFQMELVQYSDTDTLINAWNKTTKIHGLYDKNRDFYSVINPKYKVTKVE